MPTASLNHISDPPYQNQAKVCICETAIEDPSENLEVVKNNYWFFSMFLSVLSIESEKNISEVPILCDKNYLFLVQL